MSNNCEERILYNKYITTKKYITKRIIRPSKNIQRIVLNNFIRYKYINHVTSKFREI